MKEKRLSRELLKEMMMVMAENAESDSAGKASVYFALCQLIDEADEQALHNTMNTLQMTGMVPDDWEARLSFPRITPRKSALEPGYYWLHDDETFALVQVTPGQMVRHSRGFIVPLNRYSGRQFTGPIGVAPKDTFTFTAK